MEGLDLLKENFGEFSVKYLGEVGLDKEKLTTIRTNIVNDMTMLASYIVSTSKDENATKKAVEELIDLSKDMTIVTLINMCLEEDGNDSGTNED